MTYPHHLHHKPTNRETSCPECNQHLAACTVSGRPLLTSSVFTCRACKHRFYDHFRTKFEHCPLCHCVLNWIGFVCLCLCLVLFCIVVCCVCLWCLFVCSINNSWIRPLRHCSFNKYCICRILCCVDMLYYVLCYAAVCSLFVLRVRSNLMCLAAVVRDVVGAHE